MSRNHYSGVKNKQDSAAQKAKKMDEEREQLLKQNQELIESIKVRDKVIDDLLNKIPDTISDGIIEVLGVFTDKLEKSLRNVTVAPATEKYHREEEAPIFVNPMDSTVELEKSFEDLGEESISEDDAEEKKKRLKEILGGSK